MGGFNLPALRVARFLVTALSTFMPGHLAACTRRLVFTIVHRMLELRRQRYGDVFLTVPELSPDGKFRNMVSSVFFFF